MGDRSVVSCPNVHTAEIRELPAPAPSRPSDSHSSRDILAILAHFQLPPKPGHTWGPAAKGEEASATGDGMNNWDRSTGTRWDSGYGLWEPFWNSIQGLAGIPWGAPVLWNSCAHGNNSSLLVCASEGLRAAWVRQMS